MLKTGVKLHVDTEGTLGGVFWMQLVDLSFLLSGLQDSEFQYCRAPATASLHVPVL